MGTFFRVATHHDGADTITLTQLKSGIALGNQTQKRVWFLNQKSAAITSFAIGCNAAPMGHACKRFNPGFQQFVARLSLEMGNQAKAAVVFELI